MDLGWQAAKTNVSSAVLIIVPERLGEAATPCRGVACSWWSSGKEPVTRRFTGRRRDDAAAAATWGDG